VTAARLRTASSLLLVALLTLALAWELWLAPLRPGGSWLALKALPLLLPAKGIFTGKLYTYRWSTMLVLAYFAEGCVRAYAERPPISTLALVEIALSLCFFASTVAYVRAQRA
jgi:uncharacterized membrane protein